MHSAPEMGLGHLAPAPSLRAAVVLVILVTTGFDCSSAQGPLTEVTAVVGSTALLPCDILPPLANDSVILVIWFKNEVTPIYSYDIRGKHSELASHWRDKELLQQRGYFRTITEPATLAPDDIHEEDEGDYRCRVDFRRSPTRNYKVRLNVIAGRRYHRLPPASSQQRVYPAAAAARAARPARSCSLLSRYSGVGLRPQQLIEFESHAGIQSLPARSGPRHLWRAELWTVYACE